MRTFQTSDLREAASDNIGDFQKPTIRLVNTLQAATGVEVMK